MLTFPDFRPPLVQYNGHLQTILPSLCRRIAAPAYRRQRIATDDGDFLDLDWLCSGHERLVIISHGLEGDSRRAYVVGMARAFQGAGWDVLAWNFRGCGGEINRRPRFTHNGAIEDLHAVVDHTLRTGRHRIIALVGFSMGGNLTLNYLGHEPELLPEELIGAVTFSVPIDLAGSARRLAEPSNRLYMKRFMRLMGRKVRQLAVTFPDQFPVDDYHRLKDFADFDGRYTAPLHDFSDAEDYWSRCSSNRCLDRVRTPTLIVNARNDPFLSESCYLFDRQDTDAPVKFITPCHGGHCGFAAVGPKRHYWSELIAARFLESLCAKRP